jgi:peptidoglycan/xylan/chitin deacetylase (PgdA/CDA1 family)
MMYLPILTYHRLLAKEATRASDPQRISVSQSQFRRQLRWLKRLGYRTIRLEDYVRDPKARARRTFAITFDDAYEEVLTLGWPVLRDLGFTATVFSVAGQLGGRNVWDDGQAKLLTADQLRELDWAGLTIGSHTVTHTRLTTLDSPSAMIELRESKRLLEEILAHPVRLLAYPYGDSNDPVETQACGAGYEAAFATDRAPADHSANLFRLRRVVVFPRNTVWEVLCKVQRWYPVYQDFKRRRA